MTYPIQAGAKARGGNENLSSRPQFSPSFDHVTLDTDVTDDTLVLMTACNIRNIDQSLLRRMKAKAAEEGLTLRDWAIRAFVQALEAGHGSKGRKDMDAVSGVESGNVQVGGGTRPDSGGLGGPSKSVQDVPADTPKRIEGHTCFCGAAVFETRASTGVTKWKCEKGHYSTPK